MAITETQFDEMFHDDNIPGLNDPNVNPNRQAHARHVWQTLRATALLVAKDENYWADPNPDTEAALTSLQEAGLHATAGILEGHVSPHPLDHQAP